MTANSADTTERSLSVLIPNFNYGRYIGETIDSVLRQAKRDIEIVISDNASTDDSVEVVRAYQDDRVRLSVNPCNLGFSANLERVASLARGRRMLLLSSDDLMRDGALAAYDRLEAALGSSAEQAIWASAMGVINAKGDVTGRISPYGWVWRDAKPDPKLSSVVGHPVLAMSAPEMLKRSLTYLRTPLPFAPTCYSKALHDAVGGYAGGRLFNPDKWFVWKLLSKAETVYFIDHELFDYRVHDAAQAPQQKRSGALKYLTDQYIATFDLPNSVLERAGITRDDLAKIFVEQDIALRGMVSLAEGDLKGARRTIHFGIATYPDAARTNAKVWLLRALVRMGPVGSRLARVARARAEAQWRKQDPSAR
jgi:glycosyltransferase involved in cell wall biosynthesis